MGFDWLAAGGMCLPVSRTALNILFRVVIVFKSLLFKRCAVSCWRQYRICLNGDLNSAVTLTPITEEFMNFLRTHPEREHFITHFRLWNAGFRTAFVCLRNGRPLCMQWLITAADNESRFRLGVWSSLYLPLSPRTGRLEGFYAFKDTFGNKVATKFTVAMNNKAHSMGLKELVTHVVEENGVVCKWLQKVGWRESGSITCLRLDLPGLRHISICLHENSEQQKVLLSPEREKQHALARGLAVANQ
ncbi:MAG TPA: hypothetical protein PLP17_01525 [Oligoflexia bacterium]|nr:hypothetical protein [Oligoflexia bacterium]